MPGSLRGRWRRGLTWDDMAGLGAWGRCGPAVIMELLKPSRLSEGPHPADVMWAVPRPCGCHRVAGGADRLAAPPHPADRGRLGRVVIAVDGELLRGSRLLQRRQVHLVSPTTPPGAWCGPGRRRSELERVPAFAPLLNQVRPSWGRLPGTIIVADALHAQVGHAHSVAALGGSQDPCPLP
jgi:hypothetical protein